MDCLLTIISITKAESRKQRWCRKGGILSSQSGFGAHSNALSYGNSNALEYWQNLMMMNSIKQSWWADYEINNDRRCRLGLPYLGQLMKHFNTTCIFQIHLKRSFASTVPPRKNKLTVVTFYLKNAPILWECCDNIKSQLTNRLQKVSTQINSESVTNLQHYLKQYTAVDRSVTNTNPTWQVLTLHRT